jgi:hypothetical protein
MIGKVKVGSDVSGGVCDALGCWRVRAAPADDCMLVSMVCDMVGVVSEATGDACSSADARELIVSCSCGGLAVS